MKVYIYACLKYSFKSLFTPIFLFLTLRFLKCPKCNKVPTGVVATELSVILNAVECPFCKEPFE